MYITYLTNFGNAIYEGDDLQAAKGAAIKAGFECDIYEHYQLILSYSPISGWRGHRA